MVSLCRQSVPVETLGGRPLCMMQNYQLLNACRIPGVRRDTHVCIEPGDPRQPKHIIVIHNNHVSVVNNYVHTSYGYGKIKNVNAILWFQHCYNVESLQQKRIFTSDSVVLVCIHTLEFLPVWGISALCWYLVCLYDRKFEHLCGTLSACLHIFLHII